MNNYAYKKFNTIYTTTESEKAFLLFWTETMPSFQAATGEKMYFFGQQAYTFETYQKKKKNHEQEDLTHDYHRRRNRLPTSLGNKHTIFTTFQHNPW